MKTKQGFTLVEIMIVVAIIGILAAIAIPSFQRSRDNTRANSCVNNMRLIDAAIEQWGMMTGAAENVTPTDAQVQVYIRNETLPLCAVSDTMAYEWDAWANHDVRCTNTEHHGSLADYIDDPQSWPVFQ